MWGGEALLSERACGEVVTVGASAVGASQLWRGGREGGGGGGAGHSRDVPSMPHCSERGARLRGTAARDCRVQRHA